MTPYSGEVMYNGDIFEYGYQEYRWLIPEISVMSVGEAEHILLEGELLLDFTHYHLITQLSIFHMYMLRNYVLQAKHSIQSIDASIDGFFHH